MHFYYPIQDTYFFGGPGLYLYAEDVVRVVLKLADEEEEEEEEEEEVNLG